jgi:hypothetical protein
MYLLAIKSFMRDGVAGRPVVLDDGTLTSDSKSILRSHLPEVTIRELRSVSMGSCQSGGTWERLRLISELVEHSYVIQLDADTISRGALSEVRSTRDRDVGFLLSGDSGTAKIETFVDASRRVASSKSEHVQVATEERLRTLLNSDKYVYARGCSAFAGFPQGSIDPDLVEWWHTKLAELMGARWTEWGTEQITSNILLANLGNVTVLPAPEYASFIPSGRTAKPFDESAFLHFVGSNRIDQGFYRRCASVAILDLARNA